MYFCNFAYLKTRHVMISTHIASQLAIVINLLSTLYVYIAIDRRIAIVMHIHWKCSLAASARYVQLRIVYIYSYMCMIATYYIIQLPLHIYAALNYMQYCSYSRSCQLVRIYTQPLMAAIVESTYVATCMQSGGTLAPCALLILTLCPCCHLLFNQDQSIYNIIIMKKFAVCPHSCRYPYNYNISGIHFTHESTRMHAYTCTASICVAT